MRELGDAFWFVTKWLMGIACFLTILSFLLFPWFARRREWERRPSCQTSLKSVSLALMQYRQGNGEYYPPVSLSDFNINAKNPLGWADALQPYIKGQSVFWCPKLKEVRSRNFKDRNPNTSDYTDYWFNRRMAGANESKINSVQSIILLGDGNDGTDATNARYSLSTLPAAWRADKTSPAYRHLEGANYAFVDGHVKWLKPNKITDKKPGGDVYTFAIK